MGGNSYPIEIGRTYHLEVDVSQYWLTVKQDGNVTYDSAVGEHANREHMTCWLSVCFSLFISALCREFSFVFVFRLHGMERRFVSVLLL